MKQNEVIEKKSYFDHEAGIGIIGHGENIEVCFADTARIMFSLMYDVTNIHFIHIVTFEFEETNVELALITWLNLLLAKAQEHQLMFGDFRLKREGNIWKGTASGEAKSVNHQHHLTVKKATTTLLSMKKIDHAWEASCVLICDV